MMLLRDLQYPMLQPKLSVRHAAHGEEKNGYSSIERELELLNQAIAEAMARSMRLAETLGEMYTVFRSECDTPMACEDSRNSEIMELSKATDRCIDMIYNLEMRRKELLEMIGK